MDLGPVGTLISGFEYANLFQKSEKGMGSFYESILSVKLKIMEITNEISGKVGTTQPQIMFWMGTSNWF